MSWHGTERDSKSGGVPYRSCDPRVRSVRTGIDGVRISALGLGKPPLM